MSAAVQRALLAQFASKELETLDRLFQLADQHLDTGGGGVAARLLLGLYNGQRFPFDLTDLRRFDDGNVARALVVIGMDAGHCRAEVHEVLAALYADPSVQYRMECWACDLGLPGCAGRAEVEAMRGAAA